MQPNRAISFGSQDSRPRLCASALAVVAMSLLPGCSAKWIKPEVPVSQAARDEAECRMEANRLPMTGFGGGLVLGLSLLAGEAQRQELFDACMVSKGYEKE